MPLRAHYKLRPSALTLPPGESMSLDPISLSVRVSSTARAGRRNAGPRPRTTISIPAPCRDSGRPGRASPCGRRRCRTAPSRRDAWRPASTCPGGRPGCPRAPRRSPARASGLPGNAGARLDAFHRLDRPGPAYCVGYCAPETSTQVAMMSIRWPGLVVERAAGLDAGGPVADQRRGDAAFVDPVLVLAERRVGDVRPVPAVGDVGVGRAGHDGRPAAHRPAVARLHRRRSTSAGARPGPSA